MSGVLKFGEMEFEREATDVHGNRIQMKAVMPYAGIVWDNGDMVITLRAFDHSPGYLAALIYHEMIHFEQFTTKGRGDQLTPYARERQAFEAMQDPKNQQYFGLNSVELDVIKKARDAELRRLESSAVGYMIGAIGLDPNEPPPALKPEPTRDAGDASFLQGLGQIPTISRQARDAFAAQEAAGVAEWKKDPEYVAYRARIDDAYKRMEVDYAAQESRRHEHFMAMKKRWDYLKAMADLVCSNPDAFEKLGREGKVPGVSLPDHDLDWELNKNEAAAMENPCQKSLLTSLLQAGGLISGDDILMLARRYRSEHPTLLQRTGRALEEFGDALKDLFPSPGTGGGSGSGTVGRNSEGGATSRPSPDDWGSLNQLRGMTGFQ